MWLTEGIQGRLWGGKREKREAGKWMEGKKRVKNRSKYKVKKGK